MVLALLDMHGFMQPLRTQGCGAEYLWGRSFVPDPISLRKFLLMSCNAPNPCATEVTPVHSLQAILAPAFLPQLMPGAQDVSMDSPVLQGW